MRRPSEIFSTAKQLIQMGWTRNHEALDANDKDCEPEDERAVKWCTVGSWKAVLKYESEDIKPWYLKYLAGLWNSANMHIQTQSETVHSPGYYGVEVNNDVHATQESIVAMFVNTLEFLERHPDADHPVPRVYKKESQYIKDSIPT